MADGGNGMLSKATVVETVLRAVYGRGQRTLERSFEVPLGSGEADGLAILGVHATQETIGEVAVVTGPDGSRKVQVAGTFDLWLWVKAGKGTQVAEGRLTFDEEIPLDGLAGMSCENETASAHFLAPPETGRVETVVRDGVRVALVPVRLSLAAEVTGDARIFLYASPSPP